MKNKEEKTNVMRLLEQKKIPHECHFYNDTDAVVGMDVAAVLGENPDRVFKTLVTVGKTGLHYVFIVPVNKELDLKKAASAVGEKNIEMIKSKDLLSLTGYVHGGCSPIGMKKPFTTVLHESALAFDTIMYSGGKIGFQVETAPRELEKFVNISYKDIVCG